MARSNPSKSYYECDYPQSPTYNIEVGVMGNNEKIRDLCQR